MDVGHDQRNRPISAAMDSHDKRLKLAGRDGPPWAGGTWSGKCGAVHYFEGKPEQIQATTDWVQRYQAWADRDLVPGYWAMCELRFHHQGRHAAIGLTWHRTDLDQYAVDGAGV